MQHRSLGLICEALQCTTLTMSRDAAENSLSTALPVLSAAALSSSVVFALGYFDVAGLP